MLAREMTCDAQSPVSEGGAKIEQLQALASNDLRRLCSRAYRQLGNAHDAEDAVQDAFLSACQHLSQFEGRGRLSTWFTTVVINSARMLLRRRRRRWVSFDPLFRSDDEQLSLWEMLPDCRPGPEEICRNGEIDNLLLRSIDQLSPALRKAASVYFVDGLNAAEAAQILGVSEGTFKSRVVRARAQLIRSVRSALGLPAREHVERSTDFE